MENFAHAYNLATLYCEEPNTSQFWRRWTFVQKNDATKYCKSRTKYMRHSGCHSIKIGVWLQHCVLSLSNEPNSIRDPKTCFEKIREIVMSTIYKAFLIIVRNYKDLATILKFYLCNIHHLSKTVALWIVWWILDTTLNTILSVTDSKCLSQY